MKTRMCFIVAILAASASERSTAFELPLLCPSLGSYGYTNAQKFPSSTTAPDRVATAVWQDEYSRYVSSYIRWSSNSVLILGLFPRQGFEFEVAFYNYDDAISLGFGAAYMLDYGGSSWSCDVPNCYWDTQLLGDKNSYGEYVEPNFAIGSFDSSYGTGIAPRAYKTYSYGLRGTTGRSNYSLMEINFQTVGQRIPGVASNLNMIGCSNSEDYKQLSYANRVFAPTCIQNFDVSATGGPGLVWKNCDPGFTHPPIP